MKVEGEATRLRVGAMGRKPGDKTDPENDNGRPEAAVATRQAETPARNYSDLA